MPDQEESGLRPERTEKRLSEDPVQSIAQALMQHTELANYDAKRARELEEKARAEREKQTLVEFAADLGWSPDDPEWEKAKPLLSDIEEMHRDERGSRYVRHAIRARRVRGERSVR